METTTELPTESEIEQTLADVEQRLKHPDMKKPINRAIKEGYTEAGRILIEDVTSYKHISDNLTTVQGRAIAVLAVDYLAGECTKKVLMGVPFKSE
jgi:hypothetical protein